VIGTAEQWREGSVAFKATASLRREINPHDFRLKPRLMTVTQLVEHYRHPYPSNVHAGGNLREALTGFGGACGILLQWDGRILKPACCRIYCPFFVSTVV
jgi:hypothetical protein